jgi:uncharacterized protein YecT (DUF1311 family)
MKRMRRGLAVLGMLLCPGLATAQHMNASDAPSCPGGSSNAAMGDCFAKALADADRKLNDTFARIVKVLSADERQALQAAQVVWIRFRDANCEAERKLYEGGSAAPMVQTACLEAETRHRTEGLMTGFGFRLGN